MTVFCKFKNLKRYFKIFLFLPFPTLQGVATFEFLGTVRRNIFIKRS